jgi:hypothetical protein
MGEAKRRRFMKLGKNITVCPDAAEALKRLGGVEAGTPLSQACDSVSTQETRGRIEQMFGLHPLTQEGHA